MTSIMLHQSMTIIMLKAKPVQSLHISVGELNV